MNMGEHYIVTGNSGRHGFIIGEPVEIWGMDDGIGWSVNDEGFWWYIDSQDLVQAHQIYENGEFKWVGPHYVMPCERGNTIEEKIYERPSDFKIDDGVVIFEEHEEDYFFLTKLVNWSKVKRADSTEEEIELGDQVEITCFGNSRVRGEVIGIVDKRFEVSFRGCKGLFYLNELVKI